MDFYAILDQVVALLHQLQRVTCWARKVQSRLDEAALEALKLRSISRHLPYTTYISLDFQWYRETI